MEADVYTRMLAEEGEHWWFTARREILAAVIARLGLPAQAQILDLGSGAGGNLPMLARFGTVSALEPTLDGMMASGQKGAFTIKQGHLPDQIPFPRGAFDLVSACDVLEHVQHDKKALKEIAQLLKPGGRALITVPAYSWLYGPHDRRHHHHRRYAAAHVKKIIRQAGLEVRYCGYFNSLLLPVALLHRLNAKAQHDALPSPWLNQLLRRVFAWERHWVGKVSVPFGLSILAVAERPVQACPPAAVPEEDGINGYSA